jgi:hypothetical protein
MFSALRCARMVRPIPIAVDCPAPAHPSMAISLEMWRPIENREHGVHPIWFWRSRIRGFRERFSKGTKWRRNRADGFQYWQVIANAWAITWEGWDKCQDEIRLADISLHQGPPILEQLHK